VCLNSLGDQTGLPDWLIRRTRQLRYKMEQYIRVGVVDKVWNLESRALRSRCTVTSATACGEISRISIHWTVVIFICLFTVIGFLPIFL
jgi:hypothetical protein